MTYMSSAGATWTPTASTEARPTDVLTDPEVLARWSPIAFSLDEMDGPRLVAGGTARVSGRMPGSG